MAQKSNSHHLDRRALLLIEQGTDKRSKKLTDAAELGAGFALICLSPERSADRLDLFEIRSVTC